MEFSWAQKLCLHLISSAYQRCRLSEQICRLAVILTRSSSSDPALRISKVSDTGIGSCLDEFQDMRFSSMDIADNWDGILSLKTTSIRDTEIHNYQINLKESGPSRITKLPSSTKNGAIFRHPSYLSYKLCDSVKAICLFIYLFIYLLILQMLILKIPNVAIQLVAEDSDVPESRYEKVFLANECRRLPISASNLELLKSGMEDYVLKRGNNLISELPILGAPVPLQQKPPHRCPTTAIVAVGVVDRVEREQLKVGSGVACCTENRLHTELVMESVIVISNISMQNTACLREYSNKTEVLYFKDFSPRTVSKSFMKALKSIDWKTYGLNLGGIVEQDGITLLEWENLPTDTHIDIVLHCYHKQNPAQITIPAAPRKMSPLDRNLVKRAVKLSLDDLKANHSQAFLSSRALQTCSYAPDLAKTIAGLILSSSDLDFKGECFSLLGLQSQEVGTETVENCIEERIVSVIELNDKKPHNCQEAAPFLFEKDPVQELEFEENDFCPLDF
ncbi:hypothetical protein Fmac_001325 [Flemingia macrophylla]|uniref:Type 2 DNA topoisomerase 6 subunit B-like n=1 Tax=Flemingia macrophylla TaxID=520843 RepID=A0ABD1NGR1_9FABA